MQGMSWRQAVTNVYCQNFIVNHYLGTINDFSILMKHHLSNMIWRTSWVTNLILISNPESPHNCLQSNGPVCFSHTGFRVRWQFHQFLHSKELCHLKSPPEGQAALCNCVRNGAGERQKQWKSYLCHFNKWEAAAGFKFSLMESLPFMEGQCKQYPFKNKKDTAVLFWKPQ